MKYGIVCNGILGPNPTGADVLKLARRAEELGFSSFAVADHVVMPNIFDASKYPAGIFNSQYLWYDPFVLLAAIAGATKNIALGTGIAVVPYRSPVQQAQSIATLDFISGGRFWYGTGLGWMAEEFEALNIPFKERAPRAREYFQVMKLLWSGSGEAYRGDFIDFPGGRINPLPVQKPHPPIIIGGDGMPAYKRIVAFGNGFQFNFKTVPEFKQMLAELGPMMEAAGRSTDELIMQVGGFSDIVRQHKDDIPKLEALGLKEIIISASCSSVEEGLAELESLAKEFL